MTLYQIWYLVGCKIKYSVVKNTMASEYIVFLPCYGIWHYVF